MSFLLFRKGSEMFLKLLFGGTSQAQLPILLGVGGRLHQISNSWCEEITPNCQLNVCLLPSFYAREALLLGQGGVPHSFPEHYVLSNDQARVHYVPGSVVEHPSGAQYSTLQKYFSYPSLVIYFFATAPIKN
jgi:hypothetical protein